jgi:hypothetical protein
VIFICFYFVFLFLFLFYFNLYIFLFLFFNLTLQFGNLIHSDGLTNSATTQPSREYYILLGLVLQFGYSLDKRLLVLFPTWITTLTSHELGILYYHSRITYSPNRFPFTPDQTLQRHPPTRHKQSTSGQFNTGIIPICSLTTSRFTTLINSKLTYIHSTSWIQSTTGN